MLHALSERAWSFWCCVVQTCKIEQSLQCALWRSAGHQRLHQYFWLKLMGKLLMNLTESWSHAVELELSVPMISRFRYCWGTASIEIMGIAHRSGGRVGDGFTLSPPAFPRSSALSGRKPALQFFPLEWECADLQQFLSKKIYIVLFRVARVLPHIMVILGSFY